MPHTPLDTRRRRRPAMAPWLLCLATIATAPAAAQTASPPAPAVDDLEAELARTRQELRTAQALIETLREEVARLQAEVRELRGEDLPEPRADVPLDPLASPASMTAELIRRYQRDLAHLPKNESFAEEAEAWCELTSRKIRGRRDWLISIDDLTPQISSRDSTARIRVFDPVSLLPIGEFQMVAVPARFASRVAAEPEAALWTLTAEVAADPTYNPARPTRGVFDAPTFVGPYIETGFTLEWVGITATDLQPATTPPGEIAETPPLPQPPAPGPDR